MMKKLRTVFKIVSQLGLQVAMDSFKEIEAIEGSADDR